MKNDIYQPPEASLDGEGSASGSVVKGVLWGLAVDIFGTMVVVSIFGLGYLTWLTAQDLPAEEIDELFGSYDIFSFYSVTGITLGLLMSVWAGYICAKKSGKEYRKSLEIMCIISGGYSIFSDFSLEYLVEDIVITMLTLLAILIGAKIWLSKV